MWPLFLIHGHGRGSGRRVGMTSTQGTYQKATPVLKDAVSSLLREKLSPPFKELRARNDASIIQVTEAELETWFDSDQAAEWAQSTSN